MEHVIREHLTGDAEQADIAEAVELAKDLGELLDRYSNLHFFMVGDSLGFCPDRDVRMEAVYAMAWAGHCAVSAQAVWPSRNMAESRARIRKSDKDQNAQ